MDWSDNGGPEKYNLQVSSTTKDYICEFQKQSLNEEKQTQNYTNIMIKNRLYNKGDVQQSPLLGYQQIIVNQTNINFNQQKQVMSFRLFQQKKCNSLAAQKAFNDELQINFHINQQNRAIKAKTQNLLCKYERGLPRPQNVRKQTKIENKSNAAQLKIVNFEQMEQILIKSEVSQWIFATVQRNRTYSCQFAHFLIPYCLLILGVYTQSRDKNTYLMKIYTYVLKKLAKPLIKDQIPSSNFNHYFLFLARYQQVTYQQTLQMLKGFLVKQSNLALSVCPYYYNFFAMVVNKQIIFGGDISGEMIPYSIDYKHPRYGADFNRKDVMRQIEAMEMELAKKYNSGDL